MIETRVLVRPTRRVRDLIRGDLFVVSRRFPGGREIEQAKAKTRRRAFKAAQQANRPNGSPTAGGGSYDPGYDPGGAGNGGNWTDEFKNISQY